MPFFKNVFKSKDASRSASKPAKSAEQAVNNVAQSKPRWEDAWSRKDVAPEEIQELIHVCTLEMKSRALDIPFLLLPFRPASDTSAARNFVRNFFKASFEGSAQYTGEGLRQELRLTEPLVLCSIIKWAWSRLPGGVVTWDAYELFRSGESDSNFASHAFDTFIPLSVESDARKQIIFDFFELLSAVAARAKTNGMGGRKLSRMAGWWAFEHSDGGKGFDGGYRSWQKAADAASHLFFAYLRSLSPDPNNSISGISALPRSLMALVSQTEYPPQTPLLMQTTTTKVVMIVDSVSPTPFALLRRAKHFEYRDDDEALQHFSAYEDPVKALTDECRRVLNSISSTNQSALSETGGAQDPSWSRFEDFGFSGLLDGPLMGSSNGGLQSGNTTALPSIRSAPRSRNTDFGRPTTPSWADFLSSGFADENNPNTPAPLLLPPDKILPPIGEVARVHSSQSHMRNGLQQDDLEPGELASINQFDLDDTFWWVWMTSLAGEEPAERKAAFGRCALIETEIPGAKWLVFEEQVKGASTGPEEGAYIAEKKGRFSFTRRGRLGRRKSTGKKPLPPTNEPYNRSTAGTAMSKTSVGAADQHARIQAAAAKLAQKQKDQSNETAAQRRARVDDSVSVKTNSVLTLQPNLLSEAAAAMKWDKKYGEGATASQTERDTIRAKYLGDINAGRGAKDNLFATANGGSVSNFNKEVSNRGTPSPEKDLKIQSPRAEESFERPLPRTPPQEPPTPPMDEASSTSNFSPPVRTQLPPTALDQKPSAGAVDLDQHPALRNQLPNRKPVAPFQPIGVSSSGVEDEPVQTTEITAGKRPVPKKLKKNTGGGGFRKLFGKKKQGVSSHSEAVPEKPVQSPADHPAYAQEPTFSAPMTPPKQSVEVGAQSPELEPTRTTSAHSYNEPPHAEATNTFGRFDQGPMDDMPAFVPEDTDDDDDIREHPHGEDAGDIHRPGSMEQSPDDPSSHGNHLTVAGATPDDVSETSVEPLPSQDRWAQIRRNAAERAARLSEEQSRRSQSQSNRTDEGETSGEETIESRVARIKARVAELTGGTTEGPGVSSMGRR